MSQPIFKQYVETQKDSKEKFARNKFLHAAKLNNNEQNMKHSFKQLVPLNSLQIFKQQKE